MLIGLLRLPVWLLYLVAARIACSLAGHWPIHPDGGANHQKCWCQRCNAPIYHLGGRWWRSD